ncbi:MAG: tail-specific protease, partial [Chloroflexi bacterium]
QLYANAVTSVYDPHTNYFSPRTGEDFDINMSLSLEGIGAQLTLEDEIITIKELIAGGPAKQSGKLARNDKILAVAQGQTGAMEDVVGWRLDDAVRLIRGKRGTTVRLRIEKAINNEVVDVVLVRDKIKLEESAAKSEIKGIEKDGKVYRIGIIDLPSFYIDFDAANRGEKNYRSTTRDVKRLIQQLEKDGIDGLMIDLRDNGGGALAEAVDLTGLFFDKGPVVQVRRAGGEVTVHADDDNETIYDGPLAVLINQNSASASEIFAGAIKDYGRGVILGEPTFGKGTVQTVIDLARFLPSVKDSVGQLKMTIAMFYRVNGSSTQLKGVTPNIYIPNEDSYLPEGEREEDHALPWHKIKGKKHQQFNQVS